MNYNMDYSNDYLRLSVKRVRGNNMARCHVHDNCELYFLIEGDRYLFAKNRFYSVRAGDIFFIPPGIEHRTLDSGSGEYVRLTVNIDPRFITPSDMPSDLYVAKLPVEKRERLFKEMEELTFAADSGSGFGVVGCVMKMLAILFSEPPSSDDAAILSPTFGRVSEIIEYMKNNHSRKILLSELSERFYISEYYLCHLFKEYTGKSVHEYLTELRLDAAVYMLKNTTHSVSEVCRRTGFGSMSAFSGAMRRAYGKTALEIRKEAKLPKQTAYGCPQIRDTASAETN